MSPCYQGYTNSNEEGKKTTNNEMQSNTKHKFECSKKQWVGRMVNGMPIKINLIICVKNKARWIWNQTKNNVDLTHIKITKRLLESKIMGSEA